MIRVGTSVGNLGKDWRGKLTQAELESLQYEVSLNGVREEIRHILDSEIARRGQLTPNQMYEAFKKYKTYVACNKRIDGRGSSPSPKPPKATSHVTHYKPRFHKTMAFAARRTLILLSPHSLTKLTPRRRSRLSQKMRDCTSLLIWRRPYLTISPCR